MKTLLRVTALLSALGTAVPLHAMPYATPRAGRRPDVAAPAHRRLGRGAGRHGQERRGTRPGRLLDAAGDRERGKSEGSGGGWGNAILTLNVDTQKAGLWAGGSFKVQTVTSFGHSIIQDTGAIVPANLAWILPSIEPDTGLQELTYTHFFSPHFGMFLGKINTIAPTNVLHGDYTTGFLYTA